MQLASRRSSVLESGIGRVMAAWLSGTGCSLMQRQGRALVHLEILCTRLVYPEMYFCLCSWDVCLAGAIHLEFGVGWPLGLCKVPNIVASEYITTVELHGASSCLNINLLF